MKKTIVKLLVMLLFLNAMLSIYLEDSYTVEASELELEETGYETPEETALAYMNAIKNKDIEQMVNLFAIETYVQHCDIQAWQESGTYSCYSSPLPMDNNIFTQKLNIMMRRNEVFKYLRYLYINISSGFAAVSNINQREYADDILNQFWVIKNEDDIFDIEIKGIGNLEELYQNQNHSTTKYSDAIKNSIQMRKQYLGCEDILPMVIECTWKNIPMYLFVEMIRYENKWMILDLGGIGSTILQLSSTQVIVPECIFGDQEEQETFSEKMATILIEIFQKESQEKSSSKEIKYTGYKTAEKAIEVFLENMKQNNINQMIDSTNLEMISSRFDVVKQIEVIGNYNFAFSSIIPFYGNCANILNREYMKSAYQIKKIYLDLVGEGLNDENEESVFDYEKFVNSIKGMDCSNLEYEDITEISERQYLDESIQHYIEFLNADKVKCFSVNLKLRNSYTSAIIVCSCYDGKWVVASLRE